MQRWYDKENWSALPTDTKDNNEPLSETEQKDKYNIITFSANLEN